MPSLAQGVVSRFDDLFKNSKIMEGNTVASYDPPINQPGYRFLTGNAAQFVSVRKHNTLPIYMIFGTVQPLTNFVGEVNSNTATISLDGESLSFNVRSQGSVYVYDKSVSPALFYQVDGWHENTHPWFWSKDFVLEGELPETASASYRARTHNIASLGNNFVNHISFMRWNNTAAHPTYSFFPRENATRSYYIWLNVKVKSSGLSGNLTLEIRNKLGNVIKTVSLNNINNAAWKNIRIEAVGAAPSLQNLNREQYEIKVIANSTNVDLNKITLTPNP
jgi:hypothetical protein